MFAKYDALDLCFSESPQAPSFQHPYAMLLNADDSKHIEGLSGPWRALAGVQTPSQKWNSLSHTTHTHYSLSLSFESTASVTRLQNNAKQLSWGRQSMQAPGRLQFVRP